MDRHKKDKKRRIKKNNSRKAFKNSSKLGQLIFQKYPLVKQKKKKDERILKLWTSIYQFRNTKILWPIYIGNLLIALQQLVFGQLTFQNYLIETEKEKLEKF